MNRLAIGAALLAGLLGSCGGESRAQDPPIEGPYRVAVVYVGLSNDGGDAAQNWLNSEAAQGREFVRGFGDTYAWLITREATK